MMKANAKILAIIPARNEQDFIGLTLDSLNNQTYPITKIIVVNDGSTDDTANLVLEKRKVNSAIELQSLDINDVRIPGAKIVKNFNTALALENLDQYDFVAKFDADLIFPENYIETIINEFHSNEKLGLVGGVCIIRKTTKWVVEKVSKSDHVRGALKFYRKEAFQSMDGLDEIMGWDSLDEYKLGFFGYQTKVIQTLKVKHLRLTNRATKWKKIEALNGRMFYNQRFGLFLSLISCLKRGIKHKPFLISGVVAFYYYLCAYFSSSEPYVSKKLGKHIRKYRLDSIFKS